MNSKKLKDIRVGMCELGIEDSKLLVKIKHLEVEREELHVKIRALQCEAEKETQV